MVMTKAGGQTLRNTMIKKYGSEKAWKEYMRKQGSKGGANGTTGGFASDVVGQDGLTGKQRASISGKKGGTISRRKPSNKK